MNMEQSEKLQKILSRVGLGSRRHLEEVIAEGRVSINGSVAKLGDRALPKDIIRVDGRVIRTVPSKDQICRVFVYHKPEGEVCTKRDPQGRPSVFDRLPQLPNDRLINVGRLDLNTSGLLLFTNDGELAHRLMHPSSEIPREYSVRVFGEVTEAMISSMLAGVTVEDQVFKFDSVTFGGGEGINRWYNVVLHEGKNREIRNVFESFDLKVSRLIRIRFGDLTLDRSLPRGGWKELSADDVNYLRSIVDLPRQKTEPVNRHEEKETSTERRHRMAEIKRAVRRHQERRKTGNGEFKGSSHSGEIRARNSNVRNGRGRNSGTGVRRSGSR